MENNDISHETKELMDSIINTSTDIIKFKKIMTTEFIEKVNKLLELYPIKEGEIHLYGYSDKIDNLINLNQLFNNIEELLEKDLSDPINFHQNDLHISPKERNAIKEGIIEYCKKMKEFLLNKSVKDIKQLRDISHKIDNDIIVKNSQIRSIFEKDKNKYNKINNDVYPIYTNYTDIERLYNHMAFLYHETQRKLKQKQKKLKQS